jgi:asparagine synthase (glutamine-hydrolysing)
MCGIVAFAGAPLPPAPVRQTALDRIAHRGPDACGAWERDSVWLGHRRLSILDPTPGANQPMALDPEDAETPRIIYNGEIYNHAELRYSDRSYRTGADTETILDRFAREGWSCLPRFDGIFGFVVAASGGRVLAARDRMGVKPVYYAHRNGGLWLASEIKAIPGTVGGAVPDTASLLEFLRYEGMVGPRTPFRGITSLAAGAYLEAGPGASVRFGTYYKHLSDVSAEAYARASAWTWTEAVERLQTALRSSVEAQMLSDVPIGTLCSGGVDSSLVTALVHRRDPKVQIFAVDFAEKEVSEREYIDAAARHLGIRVHTTVLDRESFLADLVECIYHNDHPLSHANSVGIFRVSRLAREHGVKVLLTGEGADELFGGYESYLRLARRLSWARWTRFLPESVRRRVRELLAKPLEARDSVLLRSADGDLGAMGHGHLARAGARREALAAWSFVKDERERQVLAALSSDLTEYLEPILQRQDRMSMMAGVESRVPFLDNQAVSFAASLPLRYRIRGGEGKALLKDCAERFLPREIVRRTKVGFRIPLRSWIRLSSDELFRGGFLEDELGGQVAAVGSGVPPSLVFALLNLELWGRIFVRGEDRTALAERLLASSEGVDRGAASRALRETRAVAS